MASFTVQSTNSRFIFTYLYVSALGYLRYSKQLPQLFLFTYVIDSNYSLFLKSMTKPDGLTHIFILMLRDHLVFCDLYLRALTYLKEVLREKEQSHIRKFM